MMRLGVGKWSVICDIETLSLQELPLKLLHVIIEFYIAIFHGCENISEGVNELKCTPGHERDFSELNQR